MFLNGNLKIVSSVTSVPMFVLTLQSVHSYSDEEETGGLPEGTEYSKAMAKHSPDLNYDPGDRARLYRLRQLCRCLPGQRKSSDNETTGNPDG